MKYTIMILLTVVPLAAKLQPQYDFTAVHAMVDFEDQLRTWDGFGFNYVEVAQSIDYEKDPQEYGGFSLLDEDEKKMVVEMVFGEEGLKVGLVKMFLDPFHQKSPGGPFNHEWTTNNMRRFVRDGLALTRSRGADLKIITTLYGPPPFITKQKFMRGRDLDSEMKDELVAYMVDWVKHLKEKEKFPIKYISLHNEGEDWFRWPLDGKSGNIGNGHDYNMFWSPQQVVDFIPLVRKGLDDAKLKDVGVTPGENTNWYRFNQWGYATAIAKDPAALKSLGLITSHGFYVGNYGRWFGEHASSGIDLLREKRPELHAWVTSTSWSKMDASNIKEMHGNIYTSKVNGIIPWSGIQRPPQWVGGDPNPGSAFTVKEDGSVEVRRGYYFYKQLTRAGQPGMAVARTSSMDAELFIIAFSANKTKNADAFVVTNMSKDSKKVMIDVKGTQAERFTVFRTKEDESERYQLLSSIGIVNGVVTYEAPAGSVTTFFGN